MPVRIRTISDLENVRRSINGSYNLRGADLEGANLEGANLEGADLREANLSGANLQDANLQHASLLDANAANANFRNASLYGLRSSYANLQGAQLQGADLSPFEIYGELYETDLTGSNLSGANLSGANLTRVYMQGTNLLGANLENANLEGADLGPASPRPRVEGGLLVFDRNQIPTNLQDANLQGANLTGTNLRGANLQGAIGIFLRPVSPLGPPVNSPPALRRTFPRNRPGFIETSTITNLDSDSSIPWVEDEDCIGQDDAVSLEHIPEGRGFRLEAENRCYDAETLSEMKRLNRPLIGPLTRIPFTENDISRINNYIRDKSNQNGGYILKQGPNPLSARRRSQRWIQDEACIGQDDPVSLEPIPTGRGFKLEAENRCYDAVTLAEMKRLNRPLVGPLTRIPFTQNDKMRIDDYINKNSRGGKKRTTHKKRKTRKTKRSKKTHKKRNTTRRMK